MSVRRGWRQVNPDNRIRQGGLPGSLHPRVLGCATEEPAKPRRCSWQGGLRGGRGQVRWRLVLLWRVRSGHHRRCSRRREHVCGCSGYCRRRRAEREQDDQVAERDTGRGCHEEGRSRCEGLSPSSIGSTVSNSSRPTRRALDAYECRPGGRSCRCPGRLPAPGGEVTGHWSSWGRDDL